jgi:hypothetical protein
MYLDLLREIEDQNTKLGGCLERGDTGQALTHHAAIRRLLIEAAVEVLRAGEGRPAPPAIDFTVPPR